MIKISLICLALSGCALCQNHPYVCATAGAVLVTSVALAYAHHEDSSPVQQQKWCACETR